MSQDSTQPASLQARAMEARPPRQIEGEYIVKLADGALKERAGEALADLGFRPGGEAKALGFQMWRLDDSVVNAEAAVAALQKNPDFAYLEPNYEITIDSLQAEATPNDPSFGSLWGLHNTGQSGGTADADIDAPEAWEISTGSDVVVAVIDTGVDYTHPDLANNMWTNPGEIAGNGIDDDNNGFVDDVHGWDFVNNDADPMDDNNHGTHVAGTIAADGNNGIGIAGVNWSAEIMALKFLNSSGSGSTYGAIQALNYATMMGVPISNNSWGGGGYSTALHDAIEAAGQAGQLVVAAAGNDGTNNDSSPHYPSNYTLDNVLSVAATDRNDKLASFSNYGATSVDLAAPGVSIYSTVAGGGYASFSGTSMATPHVAGAAALLLSAEPGLSPTEIKDRLMGTADPLSVLSGKVVSGARLNVDNAVRAGSLDPGSIAGTVWDDADGDGIRDAGEAGLAGRTVFLDANGNGVPDLDGGEATATTGADGSYSFADLAFGTYTVAQLVPDHWQQTAPLSEPGYAALDSNDAGGPDFAWTDISAFGTALTIGDESHTSVPLPFDFPFYGGTYDKVAVSSNGFLSFGTVPSYTWTNDVIPHTDLPNALIAGFWADLDGGYSPSDVPLAAWHDTAADRFIIQFTEVPYFQDPDAYNTFQVILESDGDILFQYQDMATPVLASTIGIENADGTDGLQIAYNAAYAQDGLATRIANVVTGQPVGHEVTLSPGEAMTGVDFGVQATAQPPTIAGTASLQPVDDNGQISPFAGVTVDDPDGGPLDVTVQAWLGGRGSFTAASLTASGFVELGGGLFALGGATPGAATAALQALVFDPVENRVAPGGTESETFVITVNDGTFEPLLDEASSVLVTSINDAPVAADDSAETIENQAVTIAVLANDTDPDVDDAPDPATVAIATQPAHGTAVVETDGRIIYTPDQGYSGPDSFTYAVDDERGGTSAAATVEIDVALDPNWIRGTEGDDPWLPGTGADNLIEGFNGDDVMRGYAGNDTMDGGAGFDQANYNGSPADYIFTQNPDNSVTVLDTSTTDVDEGTDALIGVEAIWFIQSKTFLLLDDILPIRGTEGDDLWLPGNSLANRIEGLGGDDVMRGYEGDDTLDGGAGFDKANYDGSPADYSFTQNPDGSVTVQDTSTTDVDEGTDTLIGVEAIWFIQSTSFHLIDDILPIRGTEGDDLWLPGNALANRIEGLAGDDVMRGYEGNDTLDGGAGFDKANYPGSPADYVLTQNPDGSITLVDGNTSNGNDGTDTLISVEALWFIDARVYQPIEQMLPIRGTEVDDPWLPGNDGANLIEGLGGDDVMRGYGGHDTLDGGAGYDRANFPGSPAGYSFSEGPDGAVIVTDIDPTDGDDGIDTLIDIEGLWFIGSRSHYPIDHLLPIQGTEGDDSWLPGNGAANQIEGLGGNDVMRGFGGNDTLDGGAGFDQVNVPGSPDGYGFTQEADGSITVVDTNPADGNDGTDSLIDVEALWFIGSRSYHPIDHLLPIRGTEADDPWLPGNALPNRIEGLAGNDVMRGYAGDDTLDGGLGFDQANFPGSPDDYEISENPDGSLSFVDINLLDGDDGSDTLIDVEAFWFIGSKDYLMDDALLT